VAQLGAGAIRRSEEFRSWEGRGSEVPKPWTVRNSGSALSTMGIPRYRRSIPRYPRYQFEGVPPPRRATLPFALRRKIPTLT
jgi:hypothetical protein